MNDLVTLITCDKVQDDDMIMQDIEYRHDVICDVEPVKRSEFYAALANNITAQVSIENLNPDEYEEAIIVKESGKKIRPQQVEIDGERFDIVRTYAKDTYNMEIVCKAVE